MIYRSLHQRKQCTLNVTDRPSIFSECTGSIIYSLSPTQKYTINNVDMYYQVIDVHFKKCTGAFLLVFSLYSCKSCTLTKMQTG